MPPALTKTILPTLTPSAERRLDAEEVIRWVLPHCQIRPYLYNQVAKLAERLQNEADEMALVEARGAGEQYKPLRRTPFILHLPVKSPNCPIEDRKLDLAFLTDLVTTKRRPMVTVMLNGIKFRLQKQVKSMEMDHQESIRRSVRDRLEVLEAYKSSLPFLRHRPRLYNQVGAHIAMLVEGDATNASTKNFPITCVEEDAQTVYSSRDYWLDVQVLDEIIDLMADGSFAKASFQTMKKSAENDAKAMQVIEAERVSRRHQISKRGLGGFEETRIVI